MSEQEMRRLTAGLPTKSAKIRALAGVGIPRADIARFLNVRYQHVRNVLTEPVAGSPASGSADDTQGLLAEALVRAGILPGERVSIEIGPGHVTVRSLDVAVAEAQALASKFLSGRPSAADELVKERRAEAKRERG
ncbi:MAG: hypothetical protein JNJ73_03945 [Hyphomonadaceae bacterium]|nr:hypothetical protein [Hyphomonadaceae bacterium]